MEIGQVLDVGASQGIQPFRPGDVFFTIWVATLDAVALPLCVIHGDGRLLFANSTAKSCLLQGRWLRSDAGRIEACSRHESAPSLQWALKRLRHGDGSSVLLTCQDSGRQAVVTVAPIPLVSGRTMDAERLGLVWITTGDSETAAPVKRVAQLFRLTRAEQHLLAELATGIPLRDAAVRLRVSIHTVRNQLKSILGKTGKRSQIQLLTLLTRLDSLRLPDAQ